MSEAQETTTWFYEDKGQRKGPISEPEMIQMIKSSVISYGTSVWKQGFPDWLKIENTDLEIHLDKSVPPPLLGENVNNTIVWVLAFAPIIGYFMEWMIAGAIYENEFAASLAMAVGKFWYVTVILNVVLSYWDERKLRDAGHNTEKFKAWCLIVPVYLYQRAKTTKQSLSYFIVWCVCFFIFLIS